MAFVQSGIPEEEQNQLGSAAPTTPNPMSLLPPQTGGGVAQGEGGAPTASGVGSPTQFGTSASKLSDYLNANEDQIGALGENVAGKLTNQFSDVTSGIDQATQDVGSQISAGYSAMQPDMLTSFEASPSNFAKDPANVSEFQKQHAGSYGGPESMETTPAYAKVQNDVQGAVADSGLVNSPSGLASYLTNRTTGTYTPGMNTLDTVLLSGNNPAYQKVLEAAKPFSGLTGYLGDKASSANQAIAAQKTAAQAGKDATQASLDKTSQGLTTKTSGQLSAAQKQAQDFNAMLNSIKDKMANGQALTQKEAYLVDPAGTYSTLNPEGQSTGIFQNMLAEGFTSPGFLSQYYTPGGMAPTPTMANTMSPEDFANAQAINMLSGTNATNTPDSLSAPWEVPTRSGDFQDKNSLEGLLGLLKGYNADQIANLSPEQQQSYTTDYQTLAAYLGEPYTPNSPAGQPPQIQPVDQPQTGLGPGGGPPYLQPPGGDVKTGTGKKVFF